MGDNSTPLSRTISASPAPHYFPDHPESPPQRDHSPFPLHPSEPSFRATLPCSVPSISPFCSGPTVLVALIQPVAPPSQPAQRGSRPADSPPVRAGPLSASPAPTAEWLPQPTPPPAPSCLWSGSVLRPLLTWYLFLESLSPPLCATIFLILQGPGHLSSQPSGLV